MTRWRVVRLDEVAEITAGNPAPQDQKDFSANGYPFVRMQDVGREHHTKSLSKTTDQLSDIALQRHRLRLFPRGTLLIPKSGASVNLNHRALLGIDAYVVSHLATVIPNTEIIDPEFLYYWSLTYDPRHQAQTTSLPSLPTSLIKAAQIPLPPLKSQREIADILSKAEGIVRLRNEAHRKATSIVPAIFLDLFGDPATNPKGWRTAPFGEIIARGPTNGLYKHKSAYGSGTPILRIDAFYDGVVSDLSSLKRLRIESADEAARFALERDDIVVNRVNSPEYLGKSALIPQLGEQTVFESNMMRIAVDAQIALPRFVIALLQTGAARQHFLSRAKHAINQSSINQQDVKSLPVILPPLELQADFVRFSDAAESIARQQSAANTRADAAFAALLASAFVEDMAGQCARFSSEVAVA